MCSFLLEKSFLQGRCREKLHSNFALYHDEAKPHDLCDSLWHPKPAQPSPKRCFSMEHFSVCIPAAPGKAGEPLGHLAESTHRDAVEGRGSSRIPGETAIGKHPARSRDLGKHSCGFPAAWVEQCFRKDPSWTRQADGGSACITETPLLPMGKEPGLMLPSDFRESRTQALPRV